MLNNNSKISGDFNVNKKVEMFDRLAGRGALSSVPDIGNDIGMSRISTGKGYN